MNLKNRKCANRIKMDYNRRKRISLFSLVASGQLGQIFTSYTFLTYTQICRAYTTHLLHSPSVFLQFYHRSYLVLQPVQCTTISVHGHITHAIVVFSLPSMYFPLLFCSRTQSMCVRAISFFYSFRLWSGISLVRHQNKYRNIHVRSIKIKIHLCINTQKYI